MMWCAYDVETGVLRCCWSDRESIREARILPPRGSPTKKHRSADEAMRVTPDARAVNPCSPSRSQKRLTTEVCGPEWSCTGTGRTRKRWRSFRRDVRESAGELHGCAPLRSQTWCFVPLMTCTSCVRKTARRSPPGGCGRGARRCERLQGGARRGVALGKEEPAGRAIEELAGGLRKTQKELLERSREIAQLQQELARRKAVPPKTNAYGSTPQLCEDTVYHCPHHKDPTHPKTTDFLKVWV